QVISSIMGGITIDLLILFVSISFIFKYSLLIGIFSISVLPLYTCVIYSLNYKIISLQKEVMSSYALAESNYIDTLQGIAAIKGGLREIFFENINKRIYSQFQNTRFNLGKLNIRFNFLTEAISIVFLVTVFGLSSWLVLKERLQLGEMVALITLAGGLVPSVNRLVLSNVQIQGAKVAFDRMFEFASIAPEADVNNAGFAGRLVVEKLHLKSISFGFPGSLELLKDVSILVKKGEIISLLGESGGGKSTLLQIIQKFYDAGSGEILINEITDLRSIPTRAWRNVVGFVPQEVKLFNGTILFNLCLSERTEDVESLIEFCRTFGFDDYFTSLPQGYYTIVGEEGINLSGGQKQLIGIARVLFAVPELLIIDEGTSAMDRDTENFVLGVLNRLKEKMGILMATHKLKIASKTDVIYILKNGSIEYSGSPSELLKFSNMYSELYHEIAPNSISIA
ncbi:MAG: peptidase C39, partial [Marivirga sp.]|nr:peptidase C39 [Marivirga sp.]